MTKEFIFECLVPALVLILLLALLVNVAAWNSCKNYSEITGKVTEYRSFDACYVKHDGFWGRINSFN